jgi:hypothetical protein
MKLDDGISSCCSSKSVVLNNVMKGVLIMKMCNRKQVEFPNIREERSGRKLC